MSRGTCLQMERQEHTNSCKETSIKKLQAALQLRHSTGNHPCSLSEQLEKQTSINNAIIKKSCKHKKTQINFINLPQASNAPHPGVSTWGWAQQSRAASLGFAPVKGEEVPTLCRAGRGKILLVLPHRNCLGKALIQGNCLI